jgi:hypothetical protein
MNMDGRMSGPLKVKTRQRAAKTRSDPGACPVCHGPWTGLWDRELASHVMVRICPGWKTAYHGEGFATCRMCGDCATEAVADYLCAWTFDPDSASGSRWSMAMLALAGGSTRAQVAKIAGLSERTLYRRLAWIKKKCRESRFSGRESAELAKKAGYR